MKIIAFIEARQPGVIEKILRHSGLWQEHASRGPPSFAFPPQTQGPTLEMDPDFIEQTRREQLEIAFEA